MAKRDCGSCRFFEKSGIGATGHCRNERCKDIVGIALVRKYELACRVGWDQDFYEPLAAPGPPIPGEDRPRLDATRQRGYQGMQPDDMVVAVEQTRPVKNEPTTAFTPSGRARQSHVSEAHRRALERKQIAQRSGTPLPPRRLETVAPTPTPQTALPGAERDWSETNTEGVSLPRRAEPSPPPTANPAPPSPAARVNANAETAALPITERGAPPRRTEREDTAIPASPPPPRAHVALSEQVPLTPPGMPDLTLAPDSASGTDEEHRATASNGASSRFPLPEGVEPDSLYAQWYLGERHRHRGKRCGNCRDFRAAETGERGYCRNRFAFLVPQLVNPNDLACLSCLGTWWAANDQWWLHRAQMSPTDAPTPEADRILDELRTREDRERAERQPYSG